MVLGSYLLGSIPWGYMIGKANGVDVRKEGSKNIGATNVTRCVGKKAGKLCFALDFFKGIIPVVAAQYLVRGTAVFEYVVIAALFATVIGHMFPIFLKFHGGKGVSTAAGAIMALVPYPLLVSFAVWVVVFLVSRYVSLASITAAVVLPIVAWGFSYCNIDGFFGSSKIAKSPVTLCFLAVVAVLAVVRHMGNIRRLLNGTEGRFGKNSGTETK